ncbi:NTP transferase domain-containing protein [Candidatus Daviesbacteria bacterium]|nr:NTP transferase domain-containing protein [Candidatus Daviesbacteria bacterium]
MKIIILAAGQGKRMWPVQTDKCLIPFLGKPLLYHNLKKIQAALNPSEVIIVTNPNIKDQISKIKDELGIFGTIIIQVEPKGMADAILSAKDLIDGEILILNAEDILGPSIFKTDFKGDVVLTGLKVDKYFPGGYIKATGNPSTTLRTGRVQAIVEKPGEGNEPSDLVKLVADYFKDGKKLVEYLEKVTGDTDDLYEKALDKMIVDGMDVKFTKYSGVWIPLKYPWQILAIAAYFLDNIDQKIYPGKVMMEEGVKVFEGAVIKGPCYIGRNCIIGNNSMVRESNLEEGVVTGFSSDITRSYIGPNSWFHTNYVGDSVIEGDFGMGSGAVLANLRLDDHTIRVGEVDSGRFKMGLMVGKGSRVGVNASIMPGVRVGANSLVGPGVVLHEDIKDNTKILVKQEYTISDHTPSLTSYDQFRHKIK